MQKNSNRRGLALGAIIALFGSLFVSAPAQAATLNADIGIYPVAESGSTASAFVGTLLDDFPIVVQGKAGTTIAADTNLTFKIEKTGGVGMDVVYSVSATAQSLLNATSASDAVSRSGVIVAGSTSASVSAMVSGGVAHLNFVASSVSGLASWSPVTLKVTVWRDNQGGNANDVINSDEPYSVQTITLLHPTAIPATLTFTKPAQGDTILTASASITGVNLNNIRGSFLLAYSASANITASTTAMIGRTLAASDIADLGGVLSESAAALAVGETTTVEAMLRYVKSGTTATTNTNFANSSLVKSSAQAASGRTVQDIYVYAVKSNHVTNSAIADSTSGSVTADIRPNQTYTIMVGAVSGSANTSVSGAVINVAMTGPALDAGVGRTISINGGAATTSYPTALAITTGTNGYGSFTFTTAGTTLATDFTVVASQGNLAAASLILNPVAADYSITNEYERYATTPGAAVTLNFDVEDQWQVASTRTDQRIKVTRGGPAGFVYSPTVSYIAVTAGKATLDFTATPTTKTGSATVQTALEQYNADEFAWQDQSVAGSQVTVVVSDDARLFTASAVIASRSVSISYSISDGVYIWTTPLTVDTTVVGSDVTVTATGLVIRAGGEDTASNTLAVRSDANGEISVEFAGERSGTFTVSYAVGTAVTTSLVIIDVPTSASGKALTFDKTEILAGETSTITGTLVDLRGNPVPGAAVYVGWTGKGLPFGANTTLTTDVDGQVSFQVLALSTETGAGKISAVYRPAGAVTSTLNQAYVADVSIVTATATPASDQRLTVGSFKGFVAIYALNYTGQKLSAKVAGKWLVVNSLSKYQRVVRNTGAGYTIKVDLHIDGVFVRSETVVTK